MVAWLLTLGLDHDAGEVVGGDVVQLPCQPVLDALEADHEFLLEGGVFSDDLIETSLDYERPEELDQIRQRAHPWVWRRTHGYSRTS